LSIASIQKQISLLKAVFEVAVNNDLVEKNRFIGAKLVKPKGLQSCGFLAVAVSLNHSFNKW
jgi:hypothetical protein